jgi:hypothetical protein
MKRFSIRALLVATALLCAALAKVAHFVQTNRTDWAREQTAMFKDMQAVKWNEKYYVPNLDLGYTGTAPEWLMPWLPGDDQDIYYRVTSLDIRSGTAAGEDFERCLAFEHVNTIRLGHVDDAEGLAAVLKKFPRLRVIYMGTQFDEDDAAVFEVLQRELPHVRVVDVPLAGR